MKKLMSLILVMIFVFMLATVTYAANDGTDTDILDSGVPGTPVENVLDRTYMDLFDEDVAGGGDNGSSTEIIDIMEEEPPKADALPQTGGIPAEVFYGIGALFIIAALILSRKKAAAK